LKSSLSVVVAKRGKRFPASERKTGIAARLLAFHPESSDVFLSGTLGDTFSKIRQSSSMLNLQLNRKDIWAQRSFSSKFVSKERSGYLSSICNSPSYVYEILGKVMSQFGFWAKIWL
jgi:hypothetical protein